MRCRENLYHLWSYLRVMLQLLPNEPCTSWHSFLFYFFFFREIACAKLSIVAICFSQTFVRCLETCRLLASVFCVYFKRLFFFPRSTFPNSRVKEAMHQTFFLWGLSLAWVVYDILLQNYLKTVLAGCYWVRLHVWSLLIVDCL